MTLVDQFHAWADQLVDLSGRNDLISFRQTKTSTLTFSPEAAARLESVQWCAVRDLFDLSERGNRSLIRKVLTIAEDNAEQLGVETLTFISGLAKWSAEKISRPQAPFLLMSVRVRGAGSNLDRCEIGLDTEGSEINPVLLQYLRGIAGVKVSDEALDEALDASPAAVQDLLAAAAPTELGLHFTPGLFIKNLTYQKLPMVEDLRRATDALTNHKVIASLAGDQEATAALQKLTASCTRTAPNHTPSREEFLILDADASQHWAINTALEGQNLVIEGPPGTGKSQTIANLIGALMARGKSVLFVAEKRAAIDAVKKRIDKAGLGELLLDLHDSSVLRARPAQPFAQALEALAQVPDVDLESAHKSLDAVRERLLAHSEALHATREPWRCSYHEVATMLLCNGESDPEPLRLSSLELQAIDRAGILRISNLINNLGTLPATEVLNPNWIFCIAVRSGSLADAEIVEELLERADTLEPSIHQLNNWLELASPRLRNRDALTLVTASTIASHLVELFGPCAAVVDVHRLLSLPTAERNNLAVHLAKGYKAGILSGLLNNERKKAIQQARNLTRNGDLSQVERALRLISQLEEPMVRIGEIAGSATLEQAVDAITSHLQWLSKKGVVSIPDQATITSLLKLLRATQDSRRLLIKAPAIAQRLNELESAGASRDGLLQQVADRLSQGMSSESLARSARRGWALQVEEKISLLDPRLTEATRRNLDSLVKRFRETDRNVLIAKPHKIRRLVAERAHAIRLQPEGQHQERLIRGEALKRRRKGRLSARRLFEAAPDLLTALKPCWAMSPLVVSQILPADRQHFDVVIFDEASQIVPHEAVTAILRAKQVVVAGDSKQLSPTSTSFFSTRVEEDDDDPAERDDVSEYEVDAVKEAESLLEAMKASLPRLTGTRTLQWHYRSEDERLIAFSNAHPDLYDRKLITLPSASSQEPLRFHLVQGSQADVSGASPNTEVLHTVELAIDHLREHPDQSLAVIAFGLKHATRIQKAFDARLDQIGEIALHPEDRPEEKFRIRNLEAIQGDERDVVIIATGYGLRVSGQPSYAFGPINNDENLQGLRRLNVAITRARRSVEVVTTINPDLYDNNRLTRIGSKAFIDYLRFARSGGEDLGDLRLEREPMNPFEQDIYDALMERGLMLVPQYGVSGYRLDFAVQHPDEPGRYVMAIEADGAAYHSSDTARDRDRIRQEHLERLGWRFHRIWSTEWLHNRKEEIDHVVEAYHRALADWSSRGSTPVASKPAGSVGPSPTPPQLSPRIDDIPAVPEEGMPARGLRPEITQKPTINDYSEEELKALTVWLQSDGILRSDDEIISAILPELGFRRRGARIVSRLSEIITHCRKSGLIT